MSAWQGWQEAAEDEQFERENEESRDADRQERVFASTTRFRRKTMGLTLDELAEELSVGPSHLSLIERGKRGASHRVKREIEDALSAAEEQVKAGEWIRKAGHGGGRLDG